MFFIFSILTILNFQSDSLSIDENKFVKIIVQNSQNEIKSGKTTTLSVKFFPTENVKINSEPEIDFKLDKDSPFKLAVKSIPTIDSLGYLSAESQIDFVFRVKPKTGNISTKLSGDLIYFFCSEKDGWCNRYLQKIELPIKILK